MRIVVNDIAASPGGGLSIIKDFYRYVTEVDKTNEWIFLISSNYLDENVNARIIPMQWVKKNWLNKLVFDLLSGKKFISGLNPDAVISMQNIITFGIKVPQVVYIHQAIPFQSIKKFSFMKSNERRLAIYQYLIGGLIKLSARKADKIIVQTQWMKRTVSSKAKVLPDKIVCIYPGLCDVSRFRMEDAYNSRSFFCPTSDELYKNNECVYRATDLLRQKGINDFTVKMTIPAERLIPNIEFTGRIPRDQVFAEYSKGTLILASYIESFPLPLEEARRIGTVILASDCEFSKEILKNYDNAYFFNPLSPEELADLMEKVVTGGINKKKAGTQTEVVDSGDKSWGAVVREVVSCSVKK